MQLLSIDTHQHDFKGTALRSAPCSALSLAGCSESNLLPMAMPGLGHNGSGIIDQERPAFEGDTFLYYITEQEIIYIQ